MVRKAFSLIELLVVIAILGCLIAVIVPCMRYSRYKAQSVTCASNLRQLALLLNSYAYFHEVYPPGFSNLPNQGVPPGGYVGNLTFDRKGWWWFHFISENNTGLSSVENMITCPSSTSTNNFPLSKLCGNYGVNFSICKIASSTTTDELHGRSLSSTTIRRPAQVILLMDAGYTIMNWAAASPFDAGSSQDDLFSRKAAHYVPGLSINSQKKTIYPDLNNDAVRGRHPGRSLNTALADGSAKKMVAEDLLIETEKPFESPAYLNWSPLYKR
jgi:prepilin-type N-terminal cleavage/methylation domain-containing protein/prepilin-type processing-associated H-X9-DG protein